MLFSVEAYFPRIPLERSRVTFRFRAPDWLAVSLTAITPVGKLAMYSRLDVTVLAQAESAGIGLTYVYFTPLYS